MKVSSFGIYFYSKIQYLKKRKEFQLKKLRIETDKTKIVQFGFQDLSYTICIHLYDQFCLFTLYCALHI